MVERNKTTENWKQINQDIAFLEADQAKYKGIMDRQNDFFQEYTKSRISELETELSSLETAVRVSETAAPAKTNAAAAPPRAIYINFI